MLHVDDKSVAIKVIAVAGKGRGRQVIAVARTSDIILMMLDASKGERQKSYSFGCIHI